MTPIAEKALEIRVDEKENFVEYLDKRGISREELIIFFSTMSKFSGILTGETE